MKMDVYKFLDRQSGRLSTLLLTLLSFFKVGCKEIRLNEDCIFLEAFMTLFVGEKQNSIFEMYASFYKMFHK